MSEAQEYDVRQYEQMARSLDAYEAGSLSLNALITNLEALLGCLSAAATGWKKRFDEQWWILEQILADVLDKGRTVLTAKEQSEVQQVIQTLRGLLSEVRA